jgi:hypothetical protein
MFTYSYYTVSLFQIQICSYVLLEKKTNLKICTCVSLARASFSSADLVAAELLLRTVVHCSILFF